MSPTIKEGSKEMQDVFAEHAEHIKQRILHALEIYPFLSASMVHMAIGTATSTKIWRPVLKQLVENGSVVCTEHNARTPADRLQNYEIYHLPQYSYPLDSDTKTQTNSNS